MPAADVDFPPPFSSFLSPHPCYFPSLLPSLSPLPTQTPCQPTPPPPPTSLSISSLLSISLFTHISRWRLAHTLTHSLTKKRTHNLITHLPKSFGPSVPPLLFLVPRPLLILFSSTCRLNSKLFLCFSIVIFSKSLFHSLLLQASDAHCYNKASVL